MKKISVLLLAVLMAVMLFAGCAQPAAEASASEQAQSSTDGAKESASENSVGGETDGKRLKMGLSLYYRTDEYYTDIENCMKLEADKLGIDLIVQDANADLSKQIQQVEDFISEGVDAIIMSPVDPVGSVACVEAAKAAGVPVFTYDGIMEDNTDVTAYTICDFYADGYSMGEWAADYITENLDGKANVAILDYPTSPVVCGERANGFSDAVSKLEGVNVISRQDGKATRADSMAVAENILTANPDNVDLFFAINYESGAGAAAAIESMGSDAVVTCVGWGKEALEKLSSGDKLMKAYLLGNPMDHAKILEVAKDFIEGKEIEQEVTYQYIAVDSENLDSKVDWKSIIELRQ